MHDVFTLISFGLFVLFTFKYGHLVDMTRDLQRERIKVLLNENKEGR